MRTFQIVLFGVVVFLLIMNGYYYWQIRALSQMEKQLRGEVAQLTGDVSKLQAEVERLAGFPPPFLYGAEEVFKRFANFVDLVRKRYDLSVEEASLPVVVAEEAEGEAQTASTRANGVIPEKVQLSRAESIMLFQRISSIEEMQEFFHFLSLSPDWILLEKMEVSGGKAEPSYRITLKIIYPLKPKKGG
ncbi:MAG: hypothetical protein V2G34_04280 [bacterium JZ-2024 1]